LKFETEKNIRQDYRIKLIFIREKQANHVNPVIPSNMAVLLPNYGQAIFGKRFFARPPHPYLSPPRNVRALLTPPYPGPSLRKRREKWVLGKLGEEKESF
jgi:hypothetical protein